MISWEQTIKQMDTIEEKRNKLTEVVHETMVKKKVRWKKKELGHKDWWDNQSLRKKRLKEKKGRSYKIWKKGSVNREKYLKKES